MKEKYVIIASQDYEYANHKGLWQALAKESGKEVIVVNIPADYVATVLKRKFDRIKESKRGAVKVANNLFVTRPLVTVRPEILSNNLLKTFVASPFWKALKTDFPDVMESRCNVIIYDARWLRALKDTHPNIRFAYYLYDEVRRNGVDNSYDKERAMHDEFACKHSNVIMTMTKKLADSRMGYNNNIIVIGNGANEPLMNSATYLNIPNSVAFIGNFRDWIDKELFESLIKRKPKTLFAIVGSIEQNMQVYFNRLLKTYPNLAYFGRVSKEQISEVYKMFGCVLIPYLDNEFIKATRPIKIVESVLAGTPVVTIPMDGYKENKFIRFATNIEEFDKAIDFVISHPIDITSEEYKQFCKDNTWEAKAKVIINEFDKL